MEWFTEALPQTHWFQVNNYFNIKLVWHHMGIWWAYLAGSQKMDSVGGASAPELSTHAIPIIPYVLQFNIATHCYILTPWPIIVSALTHQLYFFCTYYSHTTETSLLCQSVFSYNRIMYSPQWLSLAVQLWGMFLPLMYHTHTYKSCRCD